MPKVGRASIQDRLHRIEGQVRGVTKMVDNGSELKDVVSQLEAVISGLESVKFELVKRRIKDKVEGELSAVLDALK